MNILEHSSWASPQDINEIEKYLDSVVCSGGQGNEAIEIGLWHANNEIYRSSDNVPVSLIFLIGDACANASLDIIKMKKKYFDKD
jgi:hypothetical protein